MGMINIRRCVTHDVHRMRLYTDPTYRGFRSELKGFVKEYTEASRYRGLRSSVIKIPVVVHVVWHTARENISDEQIKSQIDALNADYGLMNPDFDFVRNLSTDFAGRAAPARIQFELACRKWDCTPTNGITRTPTDKTEFNISSCDTMDMSDLNEVKHSRFGIEAWPADRYLNIWVCNFTVNYYQYTGYSEFPGAPADIDGVVINYMAFGRNKTIPVNGHTPEWQLWKSYNKGRSATHEIGHWLNLYHIGGDCDPPTCKDSDLVLDTPTQISQVSVCPHYYADDALTCAYKNYKSSDASTFDFKDCKARHFKTCLPDAPDYPNDPIVDPQDPQNPGNSDIDMFMNYMDYTQDMCKVMFTAGQVRRMEATLDGPRRSLLGSDGCIPVTDNMGADLWVRNSPDDIGLEPDTYSQLMYVSDDIWVNSGHDIMVSDHENAVGGVPCKVYVRVRNRGCRQTKKSAVILYWAKASTGLGWPDPWTGNVTHPALMGNKIGEVILDDMGPHESRIVPFDWTPPNPGDYAIFGSDRTHFCLLARIVEIGAPNAGMSFPEGNDLWENVKNNNNIAWKNITVCEKIERIWAGYVSLCPIPMPHQPDELTPMHTPVTNEIEKRRIQRMEEPVNVRLEFLTPGKHTERSFDIPDSALDWGKIDVELGKDLFTQWSMHDSPSSGLVAKDNYTVNIVESKAHIDIKLKPGTFHTIKVSFTPNSESRDGYHVFPFDIVQLQQDENGLHPVGGQRFIVKTLYRDRPIG